jgi:hypothetical protein
LLGRWFAFALFALSVPVTGAAAYSPSDRQCFDSAVLATTLFQDTSPPAEQSYEWTSPVTWKIKIEKVLIGRPVAGRQKVVVYQHAFYRKAFKRHVLLFIQHRENEPDQAIMYRDSVGPPYGSGLLNRVNRIAESYGLERCKAP